MELDRVALPLEYMKDVVFKLCLLLCFVFLGAAPIPYVQKAILNLPHSYLRHTTIHVLLNVYMHVFLWLQAELLYDSNQKLTSFKYGLPQFF